MKTRLTDVQNEIGQRSETQVGRYRERSSQKKNITRAKKQIKIFFQITTKSKRS